MYFQHLDPNQEYYGSFQQLEGVEMKYDYNNLKSPNEEEHLNSGAKWKKYVNIGQYVFNSNLKCWILQNVMLYFVCKIMLKLCVLNVKARLLYCKANLILSLSTCQRTRQNVLFFFKYLLSNNLKIRKESPNSSLEEKA